MYSYKKQLQSLFSQLQFTVKLPTNKSLKLDYNPIYGGYRIDIINKLNGASSFFSFSSRVSTKEMVSFIQGYLHASSGLYINNK